jgi:hypothetical protein
MKLKDFEVAGFKFERTESTGAVDRYDHTLPNGDKLVVVNNQGMRFRPASQTRWTAYRLANDAVGHWTPIKGPSGRTRYFGTPDVAAGQALKEWAIK